MRRELQAEQVVDGGAGRRRCGRWRRRRSVERTAAAPEAHAGGGSSGSGIERSGRHRYLLGGRQLFAQGRDGSARLVQQIAQLCLILMLHLRRLASQRLAGVALVLEVGEHVTLSMKTLRVDLRVSLTQLPR